MQSPSVATVREFNRFYTTILGVVNNRFLEGSFSLAEARVIYEAGIQHGITAREIMDRLHIDEGYLSRLVAGLVRKNIIAKKQSRKDKRLFILELTATGRKALASINEQSDQHAKELIHHLTEREQKKITVLLLEAKRLLTKSDPAQQPQHFDIRLAKTADDFDQARKIFKEYGASLDFDLAYQDFNKELATLRQQYHSPSGALLLCVHQQQNIVGCVAVRKLTTTTSELKRLYVKPAFRHHRLGIRLLTIAMAKATNLGYQYLRLDTVPGQEKAQQLYLKLGFYKIKPYRRSPIKGTLYLEKKLV